MSTLVNPALGRASTGFTMAGCTISVAGVITPGTAKTFTGQLTSWDMNETNDVENISAVTARNANEVIIETVNTLSIEGFLFANDTIAVPTNPIFTISGAFDFVQVVGSWAGRTFTFIGVIKAYKENIAGKGKISFSMEIGFPDIGTANPAFS